MSHQIADDEHNRSGTQQPTDDNSSVTPDLDRPRVRLPDRVTQLCSSFVSGVLLVSNELDVDGELVNPGTASRIGTK